MKTDPRIESFRAAADQRPITGWHIRILALLVLLLVADGYDTQAIGYVAPALVDAWGVKRSALGPVFSAGLFGVMIGSLTMTPLADKVGIRRVLIACAGLFGILSICTAFAPNLNALLALRFITGVALGGAMPSAIALVSDYAPSRIRALTVTIAVCGFSLGGAFGGVAATVAIADFGWPAVFMIGGIIPLVLTPLLAMWLPESLPRLLAGRGSEAERQRMVDRLAPGWTPPPEVAAEAAPPQAPVAALLSGGLAVSTLLIWTVYFMNLLNLYTLSSWLPTILHGDGVSIGMANFATTFYQLGGTIGALGLAVLCDRFKSQNVLAIAFCCAAVAVFLIGSAGGDPVLLVSFISAAGFFVVGGQNTANAFVGGFYPSHIRATGIGWALGIGRIGSILGPLLIGALVAKGVDTATLFRLCAIPALIAAICVFLVGRTGARAGQGTAAGAVARS